MTRRLTLAIIGAVAATLVVAGLVTLALASLGARRDAERDLREEVEAIAGGLESFDRPPLAAFARALDLEDLGIVRVTRRGAIGSLPAGVRPADLDPDRLAAGETVSGAHGSLVYAAALARLAPDDRAGAAAVVVATDEAGTALGQAVRWFLVAAAGTLVAGALGARVLGARLAGPVRAADRAARRIADGDLAARVPDPPGAPDDELAELARSVNRMAAALERARDLERQFLLSVSHDLRTPLTSIRGYAEAVADGTEPDPRRAASVILFEARRLERLVADLLELARLEARRFAFDLGPVDVGEVVAASASGFAPAAGEAGVELTLSRAPRPVVAVADADRLAQVVANLLENGLRFASARIDVTVERAGDSALVIVDDDGPGLAAPDATRAFDRLYAPERAAARPGPGSGLGLAIVRELAGGMGGAVAAGRSPAGGARFEVRLPLAADA